MSQEKAPPIDGAYWLRRWKEKDTGWHQDAPEEVLVRRFGDLAPTRVLVPLCGKSLDLVWLASRGHDVVGVELSELAVESFFREQDLKQETVPAGAFQRHMAVGTKITILQGDFFKLEPADVGPFGALYDRGALGALPPDLRARYVARISELVKAAGTHGFRFLELVLERTPHTEDGPPFSILESMLRSYYGRDFEIKLLEREDAGLEHASGARTDQCVYALTLR